MHNLETFVLNSVTTQQALRNVMAQLSGWQVVIVWLRYNGWTNQQIADAAGLTPQAVSDQMKQIRRKAKASGQALQ